MDGYHAMEMEFEEFETNVDPDLTQNDSMNQTQTLANFTKEEKSMLKHFYAEIPNPTDIEIETLAHQIEHQSEKVHKWFQYKKSEKQKKCITCLKNFGFLFDWKKQLKKHITEGCQQTEKQRANFGNNINGAKIFSCNRCDESYNDYTDLNRHFKSAHKDEISNKIPDFAKIPRKYLKVANNDGLTPYQLAAKMYHFKNTDFSKTSLHIAVEENNIGFAKFLIDKGVSVHDKDRYGRTPLHWAKEIEMVKLLVENEANVNAKNNLGWTPLHEVVEDKNQKGIVKFLIENGANINAKTSTGSTSLHIAALNKNRKEILKFLIQNGAKVNAGDDLGETPLHFAVRYNHITIAKILIENGANINAKTSEQGTPLHFAVFKSRSKQLEMVKLLIEKGANVNGDEDTGWNPLSYAAKHNRIKIAKVLIEHGARVNKINEETSSPLYLAAENGCYDIVKYLIENGANVNDKDFVTGITPLHGAVQCNQINMVKLLIENGASVNAKNDKGGSPLHLAAKNGCNDIVKYLIENGARIDGEDKTPIYVAAENGHFGIVELLNETKKRKAETELPEETFSNKDPCMICLGPKNGLYVLLPCGHASLCELCCLKIMFQNDYSKCPSCRKPIQDYKKVFIVTN